MNSYNQSHTKIKKVLHLGEHGYRIEEEKVTAEKKPVNKRLFSLFSLASELGFAVSIPIVGGIALGKWLDAIFHSYPKLTLSFLVTGVILGSTALYNIIRVGSQKD